MTVEAEETTADVIIPCPGCSSNNTHIRMIKRPKKKKSCPSSRTVRIGYSWADSAEDTKEVRSVQRRLHPYKFLSVIGLGSERNPIINPPKPKVKQVTESMRNFVQYFALRLMI